jgi:hypothetical protein
MAPSHAIGLTVTPRTQSYFVQNRCALFSFAVHDVRWDSTWLEIAKLVKCSSISSCRMPLRNKIFAMYRLCVISFDFPCSKIGWYRSKSKQINIQSRFRFQPLACDVIRFQIENRYPFSHWVEAHQSSTRFELLRRISGWVSSVVQTRSSIHGMAMTFDQIIIHRG